MPLYMIQNIHSEKQIKMVKIVMGDEFLGGMFLGPVFLCWKLCPMPTSGYEG